MKPKKWYIKVTKENLDTLYKWLIKQPNVDTDYKPYINCFILSIPIEDNSYQDYSDDAENAKDLGCIEISFDEFKLWILKQLPEHWCISLSRKNIDTIREYYKEILNKDERYCDIADNNYLVSDPWDNDTYISYCYTLPKQGKYTELSLQEFKELVLKKIPVEENKYNIEVGDSIKIDGIWEVMDVSSEGVMMDIFYLWNKANKCLDEKTWTLIKKEKMMEDRMYSLEELKNKNIAVYIETEEQWNKLEVIEFFHMTSKFCGGNYYYLSRGTWIGSSPLPGDVGIKFNQIKFNDMKEEKTIIGYKLIKPEYESVVVKVLGLSSVFSPNIIIAGMIGYYLPKIKELGILDWFEPVYKEEELIVGEWYYQTEWGIRPIVFQIKRIKSGLVWADDFNGESQSTIERFRECCRKATLEEIKQVENNILLEEAKKKYPIGTYYIPTSRVEKRHDISSGKFFWSTTDRIEDVVNHTGIYEGGKWAKIGPCLPQIEINGYKIEFFDEYVKFGCQKYTKDFLFTLWTCLDKNNFKMDYKDELKKIIDYYTNK